MLVAYRVYEISKEHRQGKVVKTFKTENSAKKASEKSIFRFYAPVKILQTIL